MNQLKRTTFGLAMTVPSNSHPSSTIEAIVPFCSGLSDFYYFTTSTSSFFTLSPTFREIFLILNFSRVLKKRRAVLSNPSRRSTECASV